MSRILEQIAVCLLLGEMCALCGCAAKHSPSPASAAVGGIQSDGHANVSLLPGSEITIEEACKQASLIFGAHVFGAFEPTSNDSFCDWVRLSIDVLECYKGSRSDTGIELTLLNRLARRPPDFELLENPPQLSKNYIFFTIHGTGDFQSIKVIELTARNVKMVKTYLYAASTQPDNEGGNQG